MITLLRAVLRLLFGFRVENEAVLRTPGPVLLLPNHVSWFDWLFLGVCLDSDWKFVTSSTTANTSFLHRWIMVNKRTFPVDPLSPYAAKRMAEYLEKGGRLVLFPEGRISRTGSLMRLFTGTGFLIHRVNPKVITAYVRGAHRLPFSPNPDRKQWFPSISLHLSDAVHAPRETPADKDQLTLWVKDRMLGQQFEVNHRLGPQNAVDAIRLSASRAPGAVAVEDVLGKLTYRRLFVGATLLGRALDRLCGKNEKTIGLLLPNVNAVPCLLLGTWAGGRVPAMLNFTLGPAAVEACVRLAGIQTVVTSRTFVEKARLSLDPYRTAGARIVFLEDVRAEIGTVSRLAALLGLVRLPRPALTRSDTAVVLFTSGSEGIPKGVELTHGNLLANVTQACSLADLNDRDILFNALPVFHSFGLLGGLMLPLVRGFRTYLYPSPLHYRVVPSAVYFQGATVMLATNTFLNLYARAADAFDFRTVRYLIAGAEKVQTATANEWAQRYGLRILEGYGATECSPVISLNVPAMCKAGTAGRLMPGIETRFDPVEGVERGGRLWVRGPNIMKGYLGAANEKFAQSDGWYDTGDIAFLDERGFLVIQGRMKRFAKVSGEMVSLGAVEDALSGAFVNLGRKAEVAIVARPDEDKGERIVAVANDRRITLEAVRSVLKDKRVSNLAAPREIRYLDTIPKLGTGKADFRTIEAQLAAQDRPGNIGPSSS